MLGHKMEIKPLTLGRLPGDAAFRQDRSFVRIDGAQRHLQCAGHLLGAQAQGKQAEGFLLAAREPGNDLPAAARVVRLHLLHLAGYGFLGRQRHRAQGREVGAPRRHRHRNEGNAAVRRRVQDGAAIGLAAQIRWGIEMPHAILVITQQGGRRRHHQADDAPPAGDAQVQALPLLLQLGDQVACGAPGKLSVRRVVDVGQRPRRSRQDDPAQAAGPSGIAVALKLAIQQPQGGIDARILRRQVQQADLVDRFPHTQEAVQCKGYDLGLSPDGGK